MTAKKPQTKLAFKLRQAADKAEREAAGDIAREAAVVLARRSADQLDVTAYSLGARGPRVKQLGAYSQALYAYKKLTGADYAE